AAPTAIAVEEISGGIHEETWFVIFMQRAEPHPPATAKWPRRVPIMRLQIAHQRNLLFQIVESVAIQGVLAWIGRIRQSALRSQAAMVGVCRKWGSLTPILIQHHTLSKRR